MRGLAAGAALALLAACNGTVGTISVSLVTAPGSPVLDGASELKVVVTAPHEVQTVPRSPGGGFALTLDLPANGNSGELIIDALDANGSLVATGSSPPFPVGAIDAHLAIYMAAPMSIGASPVSLSPVLSEVAAGALSYGAVFAGGRDANGTAQDAISIYNAYDHTLVAGKPLPEARAGLALGVGANGVVYLFGGNDAMGAARSQLWRFDTKASPNGSYVDFGDKTGYARADQAAVAVGADQFVLTGAPAAELAGLDGSVSPLTAVASLPRGAASTLDSTGAAVAIFAGPAGIVRFKNGAFDTLAPGDHTAASAVTLPDGSVLVACGVAPASVVDPTAGTVTPVSIPDAETCALAATSRYVVVVAGATASVYALDFTLAARIALAGNRAGPQAIALPNGQVLIAGGGVDTLELFTPDPVE